MCKSIPDGVYPTMLTPFTAENKIDYKGVEALLEWYSDHGVAGVFAVCQSSEMFFLSEQERLELTKFIVEHAPKHFTVIASGHVDETPEQQAAYAKKALQLGIHSYVFISNKFAAEDESEVVAKKAIEFMLSAIPDASFGIYECPYPYKRLVSPELLNWCANTGRFSFLKDTCCNVEQLQAKINAVKGTSLKIYNANAATLLESLKMGCAGYSGVMANFHPDLYAWLCKNYTAHPEEAAKMQAVLGTLSMTECQEYPINAKYYLGLEGLPFGTHCRVKEDSRLTQSRRMEIDQLQTTTELLRKTLAI